ncbi:hypothetical protein SO802_015591 [Lithocarpus litseifolius]|uniref:Uncharacterized protein n=1 Tax=Lithocarpus litseifolius TaxID=425828 RepID=A0AAW2CY85_9ROSI
MGYILSNVLGFTRKLLQWWNNCLTEESKNDINYAVQKDEEGLPIFDERLGKGIPDGVNTLIYMIMKHFVGKPSNITSRIYDQLSNLRCRTLEDYRWYEDVFTTKVMHRSDCNSPFWKEKFINGLPRLFGEKVKETLCNLLGVIDYDNLTYGDIFSKIHSEGMKMCREQTPFKRKSKFRGKESLEKFHRKRTASKYNRKQKYSNFKDNDFYKKGKPSRSKSTGKFEKSTSKASRKCFNCELDHIESESASSSSDHEIHQLNQSLSSEPSRASESSSGQDIGLACKDSCCRNKTMNVLSKQISVLIRETSKPEPRIREPRVDLEKIYDRFSKSKNEVTVNDLQKEIKETKSEVRTPKQELTILRVDNSLLDQRVKNLESTSHQGNEEGTSF